MCSDRVRLERRTSNDEVLAKITTFYILTKVTDNVLQMETAQKLVTF